MAATEKSRSPLKFCPKAQKIKFKGAVTPLWVWGEASGPVPGLAWELVHNGRDCTCEKASIYANGL